MSFNAVMPDEPDNPGDTVTITVSGPSGLCKSVVLSRIAQMLEDDFGATVKAPGYEEEQVKGWPAAHSRQQQRIIANTRWHLEEHHIAAIERSDAIVQSLMMDFLESKQKINQWEESHQETPRVATARHLHRDCGEPFVAVSNGTSHRALEQRYQSVDTHVAMKWWLAFKRFFSR